MSGTPVITTNLPEARAFAPAILPPAAGPLDELFQNPLLNADTLTVLASEAAAPIRPKTADAVQLLHATEVLEAHPRRFLTADYKRLISLSDQASLFDISKRLEALIRQSRDGHLTQAPSWKEFHNPLNRGDLTLGEALDALKAFAFPQDKIPMFVRLIENPNWDWLPFYDFFPGGTTLATHDAIHMILGRGLLEHDEAFVIGFTMGASGEMSDWKSRLFSLVSGSLYPDGYRFGDSALEIFADAARLASHSGCSVLHTQSYETMLDQPLAHLRAQLGIAEAPLAHYYRNEAARFPGNIASNNAAAGAGGIG
jgi:hypothetical protein